MYTDKSNDNEKYKYYFLAIQLMHYQKILRHSKIKHIVKYCPLSVNASNNKR